MSNSYEFRLELLKWCKNASMDELKQALLEVREEYRNDNNMSPRISIRMQWISKEIQERLLNWYVAL